MIEIRKIKLENSHVKTMKNNSLWISNGEDKDTCYIDVNIYQAIDPDRNIFEMYPLPEKIISQIVKYVREEL